MNKSPFPTTGKTWLLALVVLWACVACDGYTGGDKNTTDDEIPTHIGLGLSGLNYTDMPIGSFYVNGSWGGGMKPYNGCCGFAGSVSLPYPWKPGTKVTVKWSDDELYAKDPQALYTAEVEVPEYPMIYSGYLWVAFFPGHEVKAYASGPYPGHPAFPDGLKVPKKYCEDTPGCMEWYNSDQPPRKGHY